MEVCLEAFMHEEECDLVTKKNEGEKYVKK